MRTLIQFFILCLIIFWFQSCTSEKAEFTSSSISDDDLFELATGTGFHYYINADTVIPLAGNSPHGYFKTKFNDVAFAALDSTGELPVGKTFTQGSLIVKELINFSTNQITNYSIMKKDSADINIGAGWVWGEYRTSDRGGYEVASKGAACIDCHNDTGNRDFVRLFELH